MKKKYLFRLMFNLLLPLSLLLINCDGTEKADKKLNTDNSSFTLWQLPSQGTTQMMSYVIFKGGKVVVIDGGMTVDGAYLKRFLADKGEATSDKE